MRPVRIAYAVSAYRNPDHLSLHVHPLHTVPKTPFLLHLDRKTDDATHRATVDGLADLDDVLLLPRHELVGEQLLR